MSQREILTNGNAFKRTDGRWGGVVWYKDEQGERKRKSFSGTTKSEVNKKDEGLYRGFQPEEERFSRVIKDIAGELAELAAGIQVPCGGAFDLRQSGSDRQESDLSHPRQEGCRRHYRRGY